MQRSGGSLRNRQSLAYNKQINNNNNNVIIHNINNNNQYNSTLTLYTKAPTDEITLDDMENLGYNRLQLLKYIELLETTQRISNNKQQHQHQQHPQQDNITNEQQQVIDFNNKLSEYGMDNPLNDNISHYILRLSFCRSEELRQWFSQYETILFKKRFGSDRFDNEIEYVLNESELQYTRYAGDDIDKYQGSVVRDKISSFYGIKDFGNKVFYCMRYIDAWELLRNRQVVVIQGYAYVTKEQLSRVIATKFRVQLKHSLAATHRAMLNIQQDKRVVPLINALSKQYVGTQYKSSRITGSVTRDQIGVLSDRSFPLCMHNLYKQLSIDNHLKHSGRQQFGLFLKGIGLSLEDSMLFWKHMFSRRVASDKFERQYAYNIRHSYGKEGKRTDYSPWSCTKIINEQVGAGDHHGCPFKHFSKDNLETRLRDRKVAYSGNNEIMLLVQDKHYQVACRKYYSYMHNGNEADNVGNHPNAYFDASMKYYNDSSNNNRSVKTESESPQDSNSSQQIKIEQVDNNNVKQSTDIEMKVE